MTLGSVTDVHYLFHTENQTCTMMCEQKMSFEELEGYLGQQAGIIMDLRKLQANSKLGPSECTLTLSPTS